MSPLEIAALSATAVVLLIAAVVVRAKRISPLGWGWYGAIQTTDGLALRGFDPVAYFSGSAMPGDAANSMSWQGATWQFASAANRAAFEKDPARYAPEFGGFCSYAASKGFTATADPTAFKVHDGRLYVFNDAAMRDNWIAELPGGVITKARGRWQARPVR